MEVEIDVSVAKGFTGETISADANRIHWADHGEKVIEFVISDVWVKVSGVE